MLDYASRLKVIATEHDRRVGEAALLTRNRDKLTKEKHDYDALLVLEKDTARLLQLSSMETWAAAKNLVEDLVTRALRSIFVDRDYSFAIKQDVRRGVSAVDFALVERGMELNLQDEVGGGVVDVVSLVLRISFLILYRPKVRPFLVLDEPGKHVGVTYQPNLAKFLKQLAQETGLTILITTHSVELTKEADQVFKAFNSDGVCCIEEETTR